MESEQHLTIKKSVAAVLETLGYDVEREVSHGKYRIDVVGNGDKDVAVEIGQCGAEKVSNLEDKYDKVLHIPYEDKDEWHKSDDDTCFKRTNVTLDEQQWGEFGENVGKGKRSEVMRELIYIYNELSK